MNSKVIHIALALILAFAIVVINTQLNPFYTNLLLDHASAESGVKIYSEMQRSSNSFYPVIFLSIVIGITCACIAYLFIKITIKSEVTSQQVINNWSLNMNYFSRRFGEAIFYSDFLTTF